MQAPHGSLALASLNERASAFALLRAEIVSQLKIILALHEAELRDSSLTWHEAKLASTGAVASSDRAKLFSLEDIVAGLCRTLASHEAG